MNKVFIPDPVLIDAASIKGGCYAHMLSDLSERDWPWQDCAFEIKEPIENLGLRLIRRA